MNWQRAVKSPQEIAYMRNAARIVEKMHARIVDKVEVGMRKCDLVAEIYDAGIRGADGFGGDYPAIVPLLPSGRDASAPHLTWDDKPMQRGEGTFFEIAGCLSPLSLPAVAHGVSGQADTGLSRCRKGDARRAWRQVLPPPDPATPAKTSRAASSTCWRSTASSRTTAPAIRSGCRYPPDWGERTMSLRPGDKTVLQPGMTFHFMTGLWLEDMGLEITESILITETGVECLANVPRKLFVKD